MVGSAAEPAIKIIVRGGTVKARVQSFSDSRGYRLICDSGRLHPAQLDVRRSVQQASQANGKNKRFFSSTGYQTALRLTHYLGFLKSFITFTPVSIL
ncbi:hypothetical protein PGT21_012293 [Puccinia graminis f. sp. tritici]|uniref:Uncharacterized protein n=1 Tax=Puccinia graminis f. sp. tritici TaxID=56615 RepID=A0A5B0PMQ9_PUCGR|nr:hypothetical protein PGT21_012293 [Puccinia graminis f. sp. tritici]